MTLLEAKTLSKTLKGAPILNDISMDLAGGKIYGLQGKNGSGKTMLLRAFAGLLRPTSGEVCIDGQVLGQALSFPPSIGVLIENPALISRYTGYKNLELLSRIQNKIGEEKIRESLDAVGLDPFDKRTYRKYSLGMKQRLGIACAVMESPDIILLDEPFNALDEAGISQVREVFIQKRQTGALLVIACHDTEEIESFADEIFYMSDGKVIDHKHLNRTGGVDKDE